MAKRKQTYRRDKSSSSRSDNFDGVYIFKLALYVILGSLWLKVTHEGSNMNYPIPIGFVIGLIFTTHEHFRVDRKIEYAVLVVAALFGFMVPYGIFVKL